MSENEEDEDEKTEEAKQGKPVESSGQTTETTLTVKPITTVVIDPHGPSQPVSFEGQAAPGAQVVATASFSNEVQPAQAGPDGHYGGQFNQGPTTPGVHTVSVESSGQTTATTFPAKLKKAP